MLKTYAIAILIGLSALACNRTAPTVDNGVGIAPGISPSPLASPSENAP